MKNPTLILILSLLLLGCSKKSFHGEKLSLISSDLFSDRPTNLTNIAVLIKLKTPSLIESGSLTEKGELVVNEEAKKTLLEEQNETLATAKKLSSDIKLLFTYRFTVNALALSVPASLYDEVGALGTVATIERETIFNRPTLPQVMSTETLTKILKESRFQTTSASHIGATRANEELGIRGKGIKVGIIDTGVDFTHAMLGGSGNVDDYSNMNKEKETPLFPNAKVVGGYDFAGPDYGPGAVFPDWRVPTPDANPMDEGGHGTHVAGSVAGLGDGVNSYDGVAPDASLYALKVFGNNGGTSDTVVIAAMEWAMDPNGDLDPSDRLDVLNLSLGGNYGKPYILYSLAVKNLAKAGVMAVISAGNSGPTPYIVGAPGTAEESISVAASVDGMEKNWKFKTVSFTTPNGEELLSQRIEAAFGPSVEDKPVTGKLIYVGEAATDFSDEVKESLKGNIALIDRGSVSFVEKVNRAEEAGALGAVVANNQPGDPIVMGGEGTAGIPSVMIPLDLGASIKDSMKTGDVFIEFNSSEMIKRPELVDTLTSFTSQGPRSEDALLKPEIAAPGFQIISAQMASGDKTVPLNGTSMSAPHMAGVMALVKERFPTISIAEQKAVVMNSAKGMSDPSGQEYSVTLQGAGLVDVYKALTTQDIVLPASISLGESQLVQEKTVKKALTIKNNSDREKTYQLIMSTVKKNIQMEEKVVTVAANTSSTISFKIKIVNTQDEGIEFHENFILINDGPHTVARVPVLGVSKKLTQISARELNVSSATAADSFDALTELKVRNDLPSSGALELFNLVGIDSRKPFAVGDSLILSRSCDLHAVGYRLVEKNEKVMLQMGVKIYSPVSNWQACELSVLIDSNGDKVADQEIGGLPQNYLSGLDRIVPAGFYSVLLDFKKAKDIRHAHEQAAMQNGGGTVGDLSYVPAMLDLNPMKVYENSHLAVLEVDVSAIQKDQSGRMNLKFTVFSEGGVESEDNLEEKWFSISPNPLEQSFRNLPEDQIIAGNSTQTVDLIKGFGKEELMIVAPSNLQVGSLQTTLGSGLQTLKPSFK